MKKINRCLDTHQRHGSQNRIESSLFLSEIESPLVCFNFQKYFSEGYQKTRRKKVHVVLAASIKAELIFLSPKIYLLPTQKIMLTIRYQTRFDLRQGLISIVEVGIGIGAMVRGIVILFSFKKNKNLTFFILIYLFNFFGSMVDIKI